VRVDGPASGVDSYSESRSSSGRSSLNVCDSRSPIYQLMYACIKCVCMYVIQRTYSR
jgi:hypothetical protein